MIQREKKFLKKKTYKKNSKHFFSETSETYADKSLNEIGA